MFSQEVMRKESSIERLPVWQCIGCGKIEAPQPCIGVCRDRQVDLVYASEHEEALARERARIEALAAVVRQLAWTTPREGEWERGYRALQERARRLVKALTARDVELGSLLREQEADASKE
jgi:hypothetical protein